jgi:tellurite resistance protein
MRGKRGIAAEEGNFDAEEKEISPKAQKTLSLYLHDYQ